MINIHHSSSDAWNLARVNGISSKINNGAKRLEIALSLIIYRLSKIQQNPTVAGFLRVRCNFDSGEKLLYAFLTLKFGIGKCKRTHSV